ncbi:MAG TPA: hypothetical protein VK590_11490 [Saprospiraceae bacterium]|nr:hypothetical protein [Saprospiraceae bacterium]
MKRITIYLYLGLSFAVTNTHGQTISDAIRYSYLNYSSSARNAGVGNSIGAFGSDFGAISQNPAGLGWYRSSEMSFGMSMTNYSTDAKLEGEGNQSFNSKEFKFGLPSIGLVFNQQPVASQWKNLNFGIGFSSLASYRQDLYYKGVSKGSIMNHFVEQANGNKPEDLDSFGSGLAYDAGGIFDDNMDNNYDSDFTGDERVVKSQNISNTGNLNEISLSFAGNYQDKFSVGATIGIPVLNFNSEKIYREDDTGPDTVQYFNKLRYDENLDASGVGINLKLGIIFRPIQALRVGLAIHTPTAMAISEEYVNTLTYDFTTPTGQFNDPQASPIGKYDYILITPWRMIGNAGVLIGEVGFLSAEVEYVDYTSASFKFKNTSEDPNAKAYQIELNNQIEQELKQAVNFRFGGEVALGDYRLRAGYGLIATPFKGDSEFNKSYSFGAGARIDKFFIDLGYIHYENKQSYLPYDVSNGNQPIVDTQLDTNRFLLTLGFRF